VLGERGAWRSAPAPLEILAKVNELQYPTKGYAPHSGSFFFIHTCHTRIYKCTSLGVSGSQADRDILPVSLTIHHYLYRLITLKLPL